MADWGDADLPAAKSPRQAAEPGWGDDDLKPEGKGTIGKPYDLSRGQSRRMIPVGSYYVDPQGNTRRNDNGDKGNPILKGPDGRYVTPGRRAGGVRGLITGAARPQRGDRESLVNEGGGALNALASNLPFYDEVQALLPTAESVLRGRVEPRMKPGEDARTLLSGIPLARGIGDTYQANLGVIEQNTADYRTRRPIASNVLSSAGTAASILVPGGAATQVSTAPSKLAMVGRGAGIGALQGGVAGFGGSGSLEERTGDAAVGAVIGGLAGGVLNGAGIPKRAPKPKVVKPPKAPDLEAMRGAKTAAYKAVDDAGVRFKPEAVANLVATMRKNAAAADIDPILQPRASRMLDVAEKRVKDGWSPTLSELDNLRKAISRDVRGATDDGEKFFGGKMVDDIDDFINTADDAAMSDGMASDAAGLIANARDLNTRYRKVRSVTDGVEMARNRAGPSGVGGNIDNATRAQMRGVLERTRNLTGDETEALKGIVRGSKGQNALRQIGRLSPQGNGLMMVIQSAAPVGGAFVGGGWGAAAATVPAVAGFISKNIADRMTQQKVQALIDLMAAGGKAGLEAESEISGLAAKNPQVAAFLNDLVKDLTSRAPRAAGAGGSELSRYQRQPDARNALSRAQ